MLAPPGPMVKYFGIPKEVVREAYRTDAWSAELRNCVAKVRDLAAELGLIDPVSTRVWKAVALWDPQTAPGPSRPLRPVRGALA
jgi:hypothetical protein